MMAVPSRSRGRSSKSPPSSIRAWSAARGFGRRERTARDRGTVRRRRASRGRRPGSARWETRSAPSPGRVATSGRTSRRDRGTAPERRARGVRGVVRVVRAELGSTMRATGPAATSSRASSSPPACRCRAGRTGAGRSSGRTAAGRGTSARSDPRGSRSEAPAPTGRAPRARRSGERVRRERSRAERAEERAPAETGRLRVVRARHCVLRRSWLAARTFDARAPNPKCKTQARHRR